MPWAWVAETTAVAAAMALVALIASRWARRKPALCHALWLLVLLKMLTPPLVHAPLPALPAHLAPAPINSPAPPDAATVEPAQSEPPPRVANNPEPIAVVEAIAAAPASRPVLPAEARQAYVMPFAWSVSDAARWAGAVWLVGAAFTLTRQIGAFRRVERQRRRGEPCPDWLVALTKETATALGVRMPRPIRVAGIASPAIWCWGRPCLLIPDGLVDALDAKRWRAIIAHELAHVGRRDHWIVWLELAALVIWWWHPLLWLTRRRLRIEADRSCDAWVAAAWPQERRIYADALLDICQIVAPRKPRTVNPTAALALGDSGRILEKRLIMILERKPISSRLSRRALAVWVILAAAVFPAWSWSQQGQGRGPNSAADRRRQAQEDQRLQQAVANAVRSALPRAAVSEDQGPPAATLEQDSDVIAAQTAVERAEIRLQIADSELRKAQAELVVKQDKTANAARLAKQVPSSGFASEIRLLEAEAQVVEATVRVREGERKETAIDLREAKREYDKAVKLWESRKVAVEANDRYQESLKRLEKVIDEQQKARQAARKADEDRVAKEFTPQIYRAWCNDILLIEVLEALPGRPITGERLVNVDGTINLGWYGEIQVLGLTRTQIKEKVIERLRLALKDEVLGLVNQSENGDLVAVAPADSNRVFVDVLLSNPRPVSFPRPERAQAAPNDALPITNGSVLSREVWSELNRDANFPFAAGLTLTQILEKIKNRTHSPTRPDGVSFYLDVVALESLKIDKDAVIHQGLPAVSLKVGLGLTLRELGLTYYIKDGIIIITTPGRIGEFIDSKAKPETSSPSPQPATDPSATTNAKS